MQQFNPDIHHRRSIRLQTYDYSQEGLYFVTICCNDRECFFGEIINDEMMLNPAGEMIKTEWFALEQRFLTIQTTEHELMIMPNHLHCIIEIIETENNTKKELLGNVIGAFKSLTTNKYIQGVKTSNWKAFNGKLWQRDYYEHIIRDGESYNNITNYIANNPIKWNEDEYNLAKM